jgi:predicted small lipoprotein YifL
LIGMREINRGDGPSAGREFAAYRERRPDARERFGRPETNPPFRFPPRLVYSSPPLRSRLVTCFRNIFHAALIVTAAFALQGCGRRGPLEPPPGAPATSAPAPSVAEDASLPKNTEMAPIDAASTPAAHPAPPPAKAPARPFPLDPLL